MTVDLTPLFQGVIAVAASAIGVFGSIALRQVAAKWHIDVTQAQNDNFDDALNKAITAAAMAAQKEIAAKGYDHVDVKNTVLSGALSYVAAKFPDALAGAGLSSNIGDARNAAAITAALTRAYPAAMTVVAASPATPPTPQQAAAAKS